MLTPTSPSHLLPPHWKATQTGDGQTYYYHELTQGNLSIFNRDGNATDYDREMLIRMHAVAS